MMLVVLKLEKEIEHVILGYNVHRKIP
eukprot:UN13337